MRKRYRLLLLAGIGSILLSAGCQAAAKEFETEGLSHETETKEFETEGLSHETETKESETEELLYETEAESFDNTQVTSLTDGAETEAGETVPLLKEPQAGLKTLRNLLLTAREPLGHTMYIWGGGWNEEDTAAGEEARSIGESPRWREFFSMQDASYNYDNTRYQIHDGLDCSGYVGWVIYNVFEDKDGEAGYVEKAGGMAKSFSDKGWGTYTPANQVRDFNPGDIMSMSGHVWISLGMCADKSVVLLHASPPGVILSGTLRSDGSRSQAVELAEYYMKTCYPDWYAKYPDCAKEASYLTNSGQMRWNNDTFSDAKEVQEMTAEEILELLFAYKGES